MRCSLPLLLLLVPLVGLVAGCSPGNLSPGAAARKANETVVLSHLKRFSAAQSLLLVEDGRYADQLLVRQDGRLAGILDRELVEASFRAEHPRPLNGYLFGELEAEDPYRSGLAAWPVQPGRTGDRVLLILADERAAPAQTGTVSHGSWRIFWAEADAIEPPVSRWPSEAELRTRYHEIRRRTPEEGLREARDVASDFR